MAIESKKVQELEATITKLERLNEKVIEARTNYNNAIEELIELGYSNIPAAEDALNKMQIILSKREEKLKASIETFMKEYADALSK